MAIGVWFGTIYTHEKGGGFGKKKTQISWDYFVLDFIVCLFFCHFGLVANHQPAFHAPRQVSFMKLQGRN